VAKNVSVRRTQKKLQDCFSYKGEDFCCCSNRKHVKTFTARARRRYDREIVRAEASEVSAD